MEKVLITYTVTKPRFFGGFDVIEQSEIIECGQENVASSVVANYEKWKKLFAMERVAVSLKDYKIM